MSEGAARHLLVPLHDLGGPGGGGGSERIALRLAGRWAALGRRVTLLCGSREGPLAALVGEGVEFIACQPPIRRARGSRGRLARTLAEVAAEQRPDVAFAPGNYHWPVLGQLARLPADLRPAVVAQISNPLVRPDRRGLRRLAFEQAAYARLRGVDAAVALSASVVADADRILRRRITRAIPLPALEDAAPAPVAPPLGAPLIVAIGRLVPQKGFDVAIRGFARADLPDARLAILGEGPLAADLHALARRLGVAERVEFTGHVADVRPWLDRARLLLLTSRYEGYGAVIVEALAAGRPVVATRCTPAADELLADPACGAVVPVDDVDALARALPATVARAPPDPAALAAAVQGFRIGPAAQAYLDLFDAVAEARRTRA